MARGGGGQRSDPMLATIDSCGFHLRHLGGFCTCFVGVWAARALCSGRRNKKESSSQTEVRRLHLWWEESHVTLKAEARARGLDSGLLKKELIRDLIMHDVYRARE